MRDFTLTSVCLRMLLAFLAGGVIGWGRAKKSQPAGLRTYMIISVGAAMSVLLTLYLYEMLQGPWRDTVSEVGLKFDGSRMASQVVTGIGFLGAGIIMKAVHQQVNGLTTATALFATVCMSLAAGAGFYEGVLMAVVVIILVLNNLSPLENAFKRRLRNVTIGVEFTCAENIDTIADAVKQHRGQIVDIDIESTEQRSGRNPSAVFVVKLSKENHSHSAILSTVAELPCVISVQELIS